MSDSLTPRAARRAARSLLVVATSLLAASSAAHAATFTDAFTGGIDPAYWSTVITTPNLYSVDDTHGDVRFAKNAAVTSPGGFQNARIALKLPSVGGSITGDFSTRVLFRDAQILGPVFNQVQFEAYFADGSSFLDVFDNYGSSTIGINAHVWDGANIRGATPLPNETTTGTLRIDRIGSALTAYFNDAPLYTASTTSALTGLRLSLQNNHNNDTIAVTYDDFALTAASVVPEPTTLAATVAVTAVGLRRRRHA